MKNPLKEEFPLADVLLPMRVQNVNAKTASKDWIIIWKEMISITKESSKVLMIFANNSIYHRTF